MSSPRRRSPSSRNSSPSRKNASSPPAKAPVWKSLINWLAPEGTVSASQRKKSLANRKQLRFETLEDRVVLATNIDFNAGVLTLTISGAGETVDLDVAAGNDLNITSTEAITISGGAGGLGFEADAVATFNSDGDISTVQRIDIIGATGIQTINFNGGTFTAVTVVDGAEDIENVNFTTAGSTFANISLLGTDDLSIFATTAITQAAGVTITAGGLAVQSPVTVTLNEANDVARLAASITNAAADFNFTDTNGYAIDTVVGVVGLTTSTAAGSVVNLTSGGAVTQTAGANVTTNQLRLAGAGSYNLSNVGNDVVTLSAILTTAATGTLTYTDANALSVGTAGGTSGVTLNNSAVSINTVDGNLSVLNALVGPDVNAGTSTVFLSAGGLAGVDRVLSTVDGIGSSLVVGTAGVTLEADNIIIGVAGGSPVTIDAGTATAILRPFELGTLINLGGADGANTLGLTDGEFNEIGAGTIIVGRNDASAAGNITFTAQIDLLAAANAQQLELFTGGAIIDANGGNPDIEVARLAMTAVTGIGQVNADPDIETNVTNLEATTATGGINIDETNAITLGGVNAVLTGLTVTDTGDIVVIADGDITINDTTGANSINGAPNGGDILITAATVGSDIAGAGGNEVAFTPAGSISFNATQDILLGQGGLDHDVLANDIITFVAGRDVILDGSAGVRSDDAGNNTGGSVNVTAGRNITLNNAGVGQAEFAAGGNAGGDVTLTAGPDAFFTNLAVDGGVFSQSGNVTINADRIINDPASSGITALAGNVDILQVSANWAIDLGSATDAAANTLELSEAELQNIVAGGILHIGDLANTGNITVTDQIAFVQADVDTLSLRTSGGIVDGTGTEQTDLTVSLLALRAGTGIGNVNDLDVNTTALAAVNTTSGNVNITSTEFGAFGLTIGGIDGITQTVNNSAVGQLIITADGGIFVGQDVRAVGNIFLTATDSPDVNDDVFLSPNPVTIESTAGDVNLRAGDRVVVNGTSNVIAFNNLNLTGGLSEIDGDGGVQIIGSVSGVVVTVNGGAGADTFDLDPINAPAAINVFGFQGDDVFNITPNANTALIIDGGAPAPLPPGDVLNLDFAGLTNIVFTPGGVGAGNFTFNAGADALQVDFVSIETLDFFDLGDLPDTTAGTGPGDYQTLIGNGGARHRLGGTLFLGAGVDFDADGQPSADAGEVVAANNGDDNDNDGDDEDGVVFQVGGLVANLPGVVTVTASQAGFLDAFIDFNSDGDFDDPGEKIADSLPLVAGVQDVGFQVPDVATEELKFTRFRVSSAGGLGANGLAEDGEVEDGQVFVNVVAAGVPEIVNGVLIVPGTGLKDNIQFIPKKIAGVDNIRVTIKTQGAAKITQDFPAAGIAGLAAFGLAGNDTIKVNPKILLPAVLLGNEGNDKVTGGGGNDVLRGGAGNDTLRGANGNDILLGEADKDSLDGQGGFDISIGGDGVDRVRNTLSQDILIGGTTNFDLNDAALLQLMAQWSNGLSFEQRTINLAATVLTNVNDDGDRDVLHSGVALLSRDWFLNFANEDKINFKFGSDRLN